MTSDSRKRRSRPQRKIPQSPSKDLKGRVIAIVGRPNVGKSTLFNRLVGFRRAVVAPKRGTTRDCVISHINLDGYSIWLMDLGGVELGKSEGLSLMIQNKIQEALQRADEFLFVCDAQAGPLAADQAILEKLRIFGKPICMVVNKAEGKNSTPVEFLRFGIERVVSVSALHGLGIPRLLDLIVESSKSQPQSNVQLPAQTDAILVAIIGRQNVGKSSLVNSLLKQDRAIVSDVPGTTRDVVDTAIKVDDDEVILMDTAGLRHRRKVSDSVDFFAMTRSIEIIDRCHVAILVLDGSIGITRDDQRLIDRVRDTGCALVLLINKCDLIPKLTQSQATQAIQKVLPYASFAPVVAVSAKTGAHVNEALRKAITVVHRLREGLPDEDCLKIVRKACRAHPPPRSRGRLVNFQRAKWLNERPICIELTTHPPTRVSSAYQQFLLNRIYKLPKLSGIPIKFRSVLTPRAKGSKRITAE